MGSNVVYLLPCSALCFFSSRGCGITATATPRVGPPESCPAACCMRASAHVCIMFAVLISVAALSQPPPHRGAARPRVAQWRLARVRQRAYFYLLLFPIPWLRCLNHRHAEGRLARGLPSGVLHAAVSACTYSFAFALPVVAFSQPPPRQGAAHPRAAQRRRACVSQRTYVL